MAQGLARKLLDRERRGEPPPTFYELDFAGAAEPDAVAGRGCDGCDLCCTLPNIEPTEAPEIAKPAFTPCRHCRPDGGGCAIYADRPALCASFLCGWRLLPLGEHWRPRDCGMMIVIRDHAIGVSLDAGAGERWREPPWRDDLLRLAALFSHRRKHVVIYPYRHDRGLSLWAIDPLGGVHPPLELPKGYAPAYLPGMAVMRLRLELWPFWLRDYDWIAGPIEELKKSAAAIADPAARERLAAESLPLAMSATMQRAQERGWLIAAEAREIARRY